MVESFLIKGPKNLSCSMHIDAELKIVYVKEGSIVINYEFSTVTIKHGQAAVVFPYWLHSISPSEEIEAYVFVFPANFMEGTYQPYQNKIPDTYKFSLSQEIMSYADSLIKNQENLTEWEVKSLYYVLIGAFFKNMSFHDDDKFMNTFLRKIIDAVYSEDMENITIKSVAAKCNVSEAFLISYFKKYVSGSFKEFVNGLLINKALDCFFRYPHLSITEIALKSGFGSVRNFNRIFSSVMGCTPSQYRRNKK